MADRSNPSPEIYERLEKFLAVLADFGLDGALVSRREDVHYLSGYSGSDAVLVLSRRRSRRFLLTDARYVEEAELTAPGFETLVWKGGFAQFAGKLCRKLRMGKIGYFPAAMTVAFFNALRSEAESGAKWRDVEAGLAGMRAVKDRRELAAMRKALACAEAAFTAARTRWKAGMTEKEVKDDLEWEMRRRGAADAAFETIVAVGANASLPHAHAGGGKLAKGKMLLIDFGARVGFYNSDLTRTLWVGDIPKVWRKRYEAVLTAQRAAVAELRPGVGGDGPDAAARREFAALGIEDKFTHGLGHGVGLAVHEAPRLGRLAGNKLVPGNIVTVEPGVYFPGSGGIRVEDMALITKDGARILSSLPRELDSVLL